MGRGQVFPASSAKSLLNPLRRVVQSAVRTVGAMELACDARVVEIGAGPGYFSPAVAAAVPSGQLVVLDLQLDMVRLARDRLAGRSNVQLVVADAMRMPFRAGSFDTALVATVLGEVPEPRTCIAEARRLVGDGGMLVVCETRRDSDFISCDRLSAMVATEGFVPVRRRGPRWQYVARYRAK
jgi:ubiquinone/menaquinone biosynthesis C-methylase UbiE